MHTSRGVQAAAAYVTDLVGLDQVPRHAQVGAVSQSVPSVESVGYYSQLVSDSATQSVRQLIRQKLS